MSTSPNSLLINPPATDFSAFDLWLKPLGLLRTAAILSASGCNVKLFDSLERNHPYYSDHSISVPKSRSDGSGHFYKTRIEKPAVFAGIPRYFNRFGVPLSALVDAASQWKQSGWIPDAVLVTSLFTYWYPGAFEIIACAKKLWPGIPVILGGAYASLCRDHALQFSGADTVVSGPDGTDDWIAECLRSYGLARTEPLVWADYSLYETGTNHAAVISSKGCPYHCDYCASRRISGAYQNRSVDAVVRDISHIAGFGIRHIAFYDDAFLVGADTGAIPILEAVASMRKTGEQVSGGLSIHLPNSIHIRFLTEKIARLFKDAGVSTIRLSFESVRESSAGVSSNKTTPDDLRRAASYLRDAGYDLSSIGVYSLLGYPGPDVSDARETYRFINSLGLRVSPALYSPVPGTVQFDDAVKNGLPPDEPLYQNKIAYSYRFGTMAVKDFNELRRFADDLNR